MEGATDYCNNGQARLLLLPNLSDSLHSARAIVDRELGELNRNHLAPNVLVVQAHLGFQPPQFSGQTSLSPVPRIIQTIGQELNVLFYQSLLSTGSRGKRVTSVDSDS